MFRKTCKKCGKKIEYTNEEELSQYFYKKGGYYLNTCIDCEHERHKLMYAAGVYKNRRKGEAKKDSGYEKTYSLNFKEKT